MKKITFIAILLFKSVLFSQTFMIDDIEYTILNNVNAEITNYSGSGGTVIIPPTVENNGNFYSVTSIGAFSFANNFSLEGVVIPDTVTIVNSEAFSNTSLSSVTIPASITSLDTFAFAFASLDNVISESTDPAVLISSSVFNGLGDNSNISLTIPEGTTSNYINAGWTGFKSITENIVLSSGNSIRSLENEIRFETTTNAINIKSINDFEIENIFIFNLSGKLILASNNRTISKVSLAHGVYILQVVTDKGIITRKFIK